MRGVGNMLLSRDREMGKAVTGFESRTVTAHEVSNNIFKDFIRRNKAQGNTIPHLYQRDLENFEIELPSYEEQEKVANVLNAIDLKIDCNNRINDNLYKYCNHYSAVVKKF